MGDENRRFKFLPRDPISISHIKLTLWVLVHWGIVLGNLSAFFILAYQGFHPSQTVPWYVALPLCTFIAVISFSRVLDCPLTAIENKLRKEVGLPPIKAFIKHYFIRPYAKLRYNRKQRKKESK